METRPPVFIKARKAAIIAAALAGMVLLAGGFHAYAVRDKAPAAGGNDGGDSADWGRQEMFWKAVADKDVGAVRSFLHDKNFHPLLKAKDCAPGAMCYLISYSAQEGDTEIVKLLHEAGSPVDEKDGGTGDAPVMRALLLGHVDTAEYLTEAGVDPFKTNQFGIPAFIIASGQGSPRILELMIKAGAPVDFRQPMPGMTGETEGKVVDGVTPLMVAAASGRLDLAETLLKHGADASLKDGAGNDMLAYARAGKNPEIEARLTEMIRRK